MAMSSLEIVELCDALTPEKRAEVADFARFLLSREENQHWERIIDDPSPHPRLEAFLRESSTETDEVFNLQRL